MKLKEKYLNLTKEKFLQTKERKHQTQLQNRSEAQQMEYIVKQLSKIEKESLVNRTLLLPELVAGKATR